MTKKNPANAPAYEAFHIPERDNAPWTRIGAARTHIDGAGYTARPPAEAGTVGIVETRCRPSPVPP